MDMCTMYARCLLTANEVYRSNRTDAAELLRISSRNVVAFDDPLRALERRRGASNCSTSVVDKDFVIL